MQLTLPGEVKKGSMEKITLVQVFGGGNPETKKNRSISYQGKEMCQNFMGRENVECSRKNRTGEAE